MNVDITVNAVDDDDDEYILLLNMGCVVSEEMIYQFMNGISMMNEYI